MNASESLSAGLKALPDSSKSFASTQAAWRFYANDEVTLDTLQSPLTLAAHEGVIRDCEHYALCIHDWSRLAYKHENKQDTYAITHASDIGYDLQSSLLVSDKTGLPIAPVAQHLVSAKNIYSTYREVTSPSKTLSHLDEVTVAIAHLTEQAFEKPLVHIIDREGDSAGHLRKWTASGNLWLVRVNDNPTLTYQGENLACKKIADKLEYALVGMVDYKGKQAEKWVSQVDVTVTRKASGSRKVVKKAPMAGIAIEATLTVCRMVSAEGKQLAQWLLLSNVPDVDANKVTLWYYWRWKIESFFKLLKQAGHQLEAWQQESASAIAKRLLVVSMACTTVWEIAAAEGSKAQQLRAFLIKLSGRQLKRGVEYTHPALLAGLWVFLSMNEILETFSPQELQELKSTAQDLLGGLV